MPCSAWCSCASLTLPSGVHLAPSPGQAAGVQCTAAGNGGCLSKLQSTGNSAAWLTAEWRLSACGARAQCQHPEAPCGVCRDIDAAGGLDKYLVHMPLAKLESDRGFQLRQVSLLCTDLQVPMR